jgi:MFS family permease
VRLQLLEDFYLVVISGVITMPSFVSNFTSNNHLTSYENGGIVGVLLFGCFIGSIVSGQTSDRFSRKYSILGFSIVFILSAILQIVSTNLPLLFIARFIAGKLKLIFYYCI